MTFADARVQRGAARFVAVRVDATDEEDPRAREILEKYRVIGLPTLVILDSSGRERQRVTSFVKPDELLAMLQGVR